MADSSAKYTLLKLPKLNTSADYIPWKLRMYTFIHLEDPMLESLSLTPNDPEKIPEWNNKTAKTNSTLTLDLGDSVVAKTR